MNNTDIYKNNNRNNDDDDNNSNNNQNNNNNISSLQGNGLILQSYPFLSLRLRFLGLVQPRGDHVSEEGDFGGQNADF